MKSIEFIKFIIIILTLTIQLNSQAQEKNNISDLEISIGIVSDVHADMMPDIPERMQLFIDKSNSFNADFIIQLGDFCRPNENEKPIFDIWNSFKGDKYHVLGNHDLDMNIKADVIRAWNMPAPYYSFDQNGFHFIILDANYLFQNGEYIDYANANFYVSSEQRAFINPEQIEWLKKDLENTDKPCLLFSHQSLINTEWGIKNQDEIQEILEEANEKAGFHKVIACFNGHDHIDLHKEINGIHYFEINSLAYQWIGDYYTGNKCNQNDSLTNFRHLNKIASYKDPLFALLKIKNGVLEINGVQSEWECSSPQENGVTEENYGAKLSPNISNYKIKLN